MDVKKEDTAVVHPSYGNLDTKNTSRELWFLRLFPWLVSELSHLTERTEIGKIRIYEHNGKIKKVTVTFNENICHDVEFQDVPEMTFELTREKPVHYAFTHQKDSGYVRILGHIVCSAILKGDLAKLTRCRNAVTARSQPTKAEGNGSKVIDIIDDVHEKRPIPYTAPSKPQVKDKRIKKSRDQMLREVLELFKEREEWNIGDMVERIDQSRDYVNEIVRKVAEYDETQKVWRLNETYRTEN